MKIAYAFTIAVLATAGTSFAQDLTVNGTGENFSVSYAPSYTGNIVGGGTVRLLGNGESLQVQYENNRFAHRAAGIPVFQGGSEGDIAYLSSAEAAVVAGR